MVRRLLLKRLTEIMAILPALFLTISTQIPDSKMVSFPAKANAENSSEFIFNLTPDFRVEGPDNNMNAIQNTSTSPGLEHYAGTNWIKTPPPYPIPPASETGYRGNGTFYDLADMWLLNAFRLSETSDPTANSTAMIGFAHSEDHYVSPAAFPPCVSQTFYLPPQTKTPDRTALSPQLLPEQGV